MSTRRQTKKVNTSHAPREGKRSPRRSHLCSGMCGHSAAWQADPQPCLSQDCRRRLRRAAKRFCAHGVIARCASHCRSEFREGMRLPACQRSLFHRTFGPPQAVLWRFPPHVFVGTVPRNLLEKQAALRKTDYVNQSLLLEYYQTPLWKVTSSTAAPPCMAPKRPDGPTPFPPRTFPRETCCRPASIGIDSFPAKVEGLTLAKQTSGCRRSRIERDGHDPGGSAVPCPGG